MMDCTSAGALIPGYLDGELSESQASLLRQHLLDCPACRAKAQEGKALASWFVAEPVPEIPPGFAQRVARRAFAGDRGEPAWVTTTPKGGERELRSYVLALTALAAGILFLFSLSLGSARRPDTDRLWADDLSPEAAIERLDQLNRLEEERRGAAAKPAPEAQRTDAEDGAGR